MAMAAEAPQIATAPPVSTPKRQPCPSARPATQPNRIVATTAPITRRIGAGPSATSISTLMRAPRSATPRRRTVRAAKWMPGTERPSSARKWNAIPRSSAMSMAGAP